MHASLAPTDAEAYVIARDQWRHALVPAGLLWDLEQPEEFDAAVPEIDERALREALLIDDDPRALAERVAELVRIGFDRVYLHHVGKDQSYFLDAAQAELLPRLREAS